MSLCSLGNIRWVSPLQAACLNQSLVPIYSPSIGWELLLPSFCLPTKVLLLYVSTIIRAHQKRVCGYRFSKLPRKGGTSASLQLCQFYGDTQMKTTSQEAMDLWEVSTNTPSGSDYKNTTSTLRIMTENGVVALGLLALMSICMAIPVLIFRLMRKLFRTVTRV